MTDKFLMRQISIIAFKVIEDQFKWPYRSHRSHLITYQKSNKRGRLLGNDKHEDGTGESVAKNELKVNAINAFQAQS
jgi:hypothetical protein